MAMSMRRLTVLAAMVLTAGGCSAATMQAIAAGMAAAGEASTAASSSALLLFGGTDHKTFLGCFCGASGTESVLNSYSSHGSAYGSESIFNHYSSYGSPYSASSACNPYASDPPVVVTRQGAFVGRLTMNQYMRGAITDTNIVNWLTALCKG